ncbi:hypothetical protein ACLS0H_09990, partial [Avibacterium avium]|uniref:hypothetical protein n=1 Tax=Avibacterium avium TaxID=751 RepID=UPI003BF7E5CD
MKDKFVMILGIGSSKFLQILFAFYLSYKFNHGALVTFFLILTLGTAVSSVVSLGATPQIIRAGAFSDPMEHIISTIKTAAIFIIISLIILSLYIIQGEYVWKISNFNKVNYYFDTMLILISLSLNSITQSYL